MNNPWGRLIAATSAAAALFLTACAPGGDSSATDSDGPIRIAYLNILSGPEAVPGQVHSLELAIKEINDAGGINGRKVEYKSFDTGITPETATRATNLALEYQPTAIIGYSVSSGLKAAMPGIKAAGIPVLHGTLGSLTAAQNLGYDRAFRMVPTATQIAAAANRYLVDELHVKSLLVIHTQDAAPTEGGQKVIANAQQMGVRTVERAVPPTATDLTEPVLAAQGADAIWVWGYSTTNALVIKQAAQNNVRIPVMSSSLGSAITNKLLPADLVSKETMDVSLCGASVLGTPKSQQFVATYTEAYGASPQDNLAPGNYDSMYLLKAAIEQAGSTDGAKVAEAMKTVTLDGACGTLKADDRNNMFRNVAVQTWGGGKPALGKLATDLPTDF